MSNISVTHTYNVKTVNSYKAKNILLADLANVVLPENNFYKLILYDVAREKNCELNTLLILIFLLNIV